MGRRLLVIAVLLAALCAASATAWATLSPDAYQLVRNRAPIAFGGVVVQDLGGRLDVRVEQIQRGPLQPGSVVAVAYPEDRGVPMPPGPTVYYRRFLPGDRLMIWGSGGPVIQVVDGGIDLIHRPSKPPKSGGCGACTVAAGTSARPPAWLLMAGAAALAARRRIRASRRAH